MTGVQNGNKLTLNATENTTAIQKLGRVEITAGTATPVFINVSQKAKGGGTGKITGSIQDGNDKTNVELFMEGKDLSGILYFSIAEIAGDDVNVEVFCDDEYLKEYNQINKQSCQLFPKSLLKIGNQGNITVKKGSKTSDDLAVSFEFDETKIEFGVDYLIPLCVKAKSDNVAISDSKSRVNFVINRRTEKAIRNYLYFEANDVNPLNALEWVLEDGTPFFDGLVMFADNIRYNSTEDVVFLDFNANCHMIREQRDEIMVPLQKKGIKIHLGLLGGGTAAGYCQLSDWGCEQFSEHLANIVDEYGYDGVNFDEEYNESPIIGNKWFAARSPERGSRLMYETKKAMRKICGVDKDVAIFQYGQLLSPPSITVDGKTIDQSEFIDINTANYGSRSTPLGKQTKKNVAYMSIELALNRGTSTESEGKAAVDNGYGWFMWFSLNPDNYVRSYDKINNVAKGQYGQGVKKPTHYYKKRRDVDLNPTRLEIDFNF